MNASQECIVSLLCGLMPTLVLLPWTHLCWWAHPLIHLSPLPLPPFNSFPYCCSTPLPRALHSRSAAETAAAVAVELVAAAAPAKRWLRASAAGHP